MLEFAALCLLPLYPLFLLAQLIAFLLEGLGCWMIGECWHRWVEGHVQIPYDDSPDQPLKGYRRLYPSVTFEHRKCEKCGEEEYRRRSDGYRVGDKWQPYQKGIKLSFRRV